MIKKEKDNHSPMGETNTDEAGGEMPGQEMDPEASTGGMPSPSMGPTNEMPETTMGSYGPEGETEKVLVEMRVPRSNGTSSAFRIAAGLNVSGFQLDSGYAPVPVTPDPTPASALAADSEEVVVVRGTIQKNKRAELEAQPNVIRVWNDTPIAHFSSVCDEPETAAPGNVVLSVEGFAACPIGSCDCASGTAKGTIATVAQYLGVDQIWAGGVKGNGIVIGIVDGGITAVGRPVKAAEAGTARVSRVIGGWPTADWGTTAAVWDNHGNMTSTDALGMAPEAQIYDIRISDGNAVSNALAGFQWAIDQHKINGTPQILSNSWGIYKESWDPAYAKDPNHPFTRKVLDALNEGIIVLFAAGNCGGTCPDGRCETDTGPGRSIWGANGHPRVITVGAVNRNEQFVGYSSQGPAALDPQKPDFCSITHFQGYFASDNGTSAATPIAAGVAALLKQSRPGLTQDQIKQAFRNTAKDIGPVGFDQHSGAGILQAKAAYNFAVAAAPASGPVVAWGPNRLDIFAVGTNSALFHKAWDGSAWRPSMVDWESLGGTMIGEAEVVAWGPNRLDIFAVGTNSALFHKAWDGSAWRPSLTGWESLGGTMIGQPRAVAWGPNRLDVFAVGTDSALYHKAWDGSAWRPSLTGWESLGGTMIGRPEVVAWGPNRLDIFAVGTDSALYHKAWDGSAWRPSLTGWESLGGTMIGSPEVVAWGPNRLDIFAVGTDSALYHKAWDGSAWRPSLTGWESLGGTMIGEPRAVAWGPNRLDIFALGTNSSLFHKAWDGAAWRPSITGWENLGGTIIGDPEVVAWGPNRLDIFALGTNSALFHKAWDGAAWRPSVTGFENLGGTIIKF